MTNKEMAESIELALKLAMKYLVEDDKDSVAEYISQARSFLPYIKEEKDYGRA